MTTEQLDPRWEWVEITTWDTLKTRYVKGSCNHLDVVPAESVVDGERLAALCLTCDQQLPAEFLPVEPVDQQQDAHDEGGDDE